MASLLMAFVFWGMARRADERLPWRALAWFASLQATCQWLEMLSLSFGESPFLRAAASFLFFSSFVALVAHQAGRWKLRKSALPTLAAAALFFYVATAALLAVGNLLPSLSLF